MSDEESEQFDERERAGRLEKALRLIERAESVLLGGSRIVKGNEKLPGAGDFYRGYNAGIDSQHAETAKIAREALCPAAPKTQWQCRQCGYAAIGTICTKCGRVPTGNFIPAAPDPTPSEECRDCHHSLKDNSHGFDQNDGWMDGDKLVHSGRCTYCRLCNPRLAAGSEQPDLPLGHPFKPGLRRCVGFCGECGQPKPAHRRREPLCDGSCGAKPNRPHYHSTEAGSEKAP